MTVKSVPLPDLVQGPIREDRPHLDADRVACYLDHLDDAPPVTVFDIGGQLLLADGHHRWEAARRLGRDQIRADVRPGSRHDALQFAVDLARQQRELSEEAVRAAIARRGHPGRPRRA
jgi:ParB-like nuclease family protein